jgi:hypothetical protein
MLNIEGRLRRRGDMKTKVLHIAEVLAGSAEGEPGRAYQVDAADEERKAD